MKLFTVTYSILMCAPIGVIVLNFRVNHMIHATNHKIIATQKQIAWEDAMTAKLNQYTERTYQCISEMYSMAYKPVDSGPVCQASCRAQDEVNRFADAAPDYIENPQQYRKGSELCGTKKVRP